MKNHLKSSKGSHFKFEVLNWLILLTLVFDAGGIELLVELKALDFGVVSGSGIGFCLIRRLFLEGKVDLYRLWLDIWFLIILLSVGWIRTIGLCLVFEDLFNKKAAFLKLLPVIKICSYFVLLFWSDCILCFFDILTSVPAHILTRILRSDDDNLRTLDRSIFWVDTQTVTVFLWLVVFTENVKKSTWTRWVCRSEPGDFFFWCLPLDLQIWKVYFWRSSKVLQW